MASMHENFLQSFDFDMEKKEQEKEALPEVQPWFNKKFSEMTVSEQTIANEYISAAMSNEAHNVDQNILASLRVHARHHSGSSTWLKPALIQGNEYDFTPIEQLDHDQFQNYFAALKERPDAIEKYLLGHPDEAVTTGTAEVKLTGHNGNAGYDYPNFPTYRYHPFGYEVGGHEPRYRLERTVFDRNSHMWDPKQNNRVLGVPKRTFTWFRFPGWRLGVLGFITFATYDHYYLGIKASMSHHSHGVFNQREHLWFGPLNYDERGNLMEGSSNLLISK